MLSWAATTADLPGFYRVRRGYEIMPHEDGGNARDGVTRLSHLREGADNEDGARLPLDCRNCLMPFLMIVGWEQRELPDKNPPRDTADVKK
jgi:hypothetical protein